jgi:integration host factor subunit beta
MATITKKELIDRIAESTNQRRSLVKQTVQQFLDEIVDELAEGNRLEFRDFGVFETRVRKARLAQNPRARQAVWVPQRTSVKFKLGRLMKLRLEALDERENTAAQGTPAPADLPVAAPKRKPAGGDASVANEARPPIPPPAGG